MPQSTLCSKRHRRCLPQRSQSSHAYDGILCQLDRTASRTTSMLRSDTSAQQVSVLYTDFGRQLYARAYSILFADCTGSASVSGKLVQAASFCSLLCYYSCLLPAASVNTLSVCCHHLLIIISQCLLSGLMMQKWWRLTALCFVLGTSHALADLSWSFGAIGARSHQYNLLKIGQELVSRVHNFALL